MLMDEEEKETLEMLRVGWKDYLSRGSQMSYVAIYPYSNSNPTKKYRVADSASWIKYVDGEAKTYNFTEHDTFDEAIKVRDEKNAKEEKNASTK